ncbi:YjjG family noncanonical pyrimidine nucleotidase [Nibrella viscosa]|uniref:YjjG family noncanonical pyrimidine nucleotidase n=1 Tax=Nibrella viscosa TaxID=1084524 RepID=A0ABP8K9C9_9BACT
MYQHLFFDLDHTLWDFDRNSIESLCEMYESFRLADAGIESVDAFCEHFLQINKKLWADFDRNQVTHAYIRENRFPLVFQALGLPDNAVCSQLSDEYLRLLPRKPHLTEAAKDVLDHLNGRYHLHIITNGFNEIQAIKMESAGITDYFTHIITNEIAASKKPDRRIFEFALEVSGATVEESIMIGDNYEADILGAQTVGMDTVFYNPAGLEVPQKPTHDIRHWNELMAIL